MDFNYYLIFLLLFLFLLAVSLEGFLIGGLAFLCFISVLQGSSAFHVVQDNQLFALNPYYLFAPFVILLFGCLCFSEKRRLFEGGSFRFGSFLHLYLCLFSFWVYSFFSSFCFPHFFSGDGVFKLLSLHGFDRHTTPLSYGISNLVQSLNLTIHFSLIFCFYFFIKSSSFSFNIRNKIFPILNLIFLFFLLLNLAHRLLESFQISFLSDVFLSNQMYHQYPDARMNGYLRVSLPFSEASYASAFFSSLTVGYASIFLFFRKKFSLLMMFLSFLCLLNSLGSTGVFSLFLSLPFILVFYFIRFGLNLSFNLKRFFLVLFFLALVSFFCFYFLDVLNSLFLNKINSESMRVRQRSNLIGWRIFIDTFALGSGLGSNRSSSYLISLMSNIGLPGTVLFLTTIYLLLKKNLASQLDSLSVFSSSCLFCMTVGVFIAIPDLNWPTYWFFIILCFVSVNLKSDHLKNLNIK